MLSKIDTLKYEEVIDKQSNKKFKSYMDIAVYIAIDGNSYKIGDTLILGNPTEESIFSEKNSYRYIEYGKPASILLKPRRHVLERYKGYKLTIEKMQFQQGAGFGSFVFFYTKPLPGSRFSIIDKYITIMWVDEAICTAEVRLLNSKESP